MIGRLQTAVEYTGTETSPWGELKLISGGANPELAGKIAKILDVPLTDPRLRHFADGEINVKIADSMRGHDVFVIQPTSPPVNEHLMELFIILDALRQAGAGPEHVVRTRIFATSADWFDEVARAHGAVFEKVRPACTYVVTQLIDPRWLVEIEAEALVG